MSNHWKEPLKSFLNNKDEKQLKVFLRQNWIDIFPEEKEQIYHFLYFTNLHKLFLYLMTIDLRNHLTELPWLLFLKIIETEIKTPPKEAIEEINGTLMQQKLIAQQSQTMTGLIQALKKQQSHSFFKRLVKRKQEIFSSAQIAKSERLMDQHVQYMEELRKYAPSEYQVTSLITDQEKNKAEGILKKRSRSKNAKYESMTIDENEQEFINLVKNQSSKYFKKGQGKATDFAYLLRAFGERELAIDFILQANESEKKDWQLLDYLFYGKQYLSVLNHCSQLKNKYAKNPDSLFPIFYIEALSYWELGEREKALDLMTQISTMRPDFKSASEILSHWKEEPFE